jgi:hypothetical protein
MLQRLDGTSSILLVFVLTDFQAPLDSIDRYLDPHHRP